MRTKTLRMTLLLLTALLTALGAALLTSADAEAGKPKKDGKKNLRVLYWNTQNGVWSGQGDNYDTFVKWVSEKDPDVCVWIEAATIFKTGSSVSIKAPETKYLPDGWSELAARYGHKYVWKSGQRDNYPQVITSKYPIENVLQSVGNQKDTVVMHGFGQARINVEGRVINFVTLHLYPFGHLEWKMKEPAELRRYRLRREEAKKRYDEAFASGNVGYAELNALKEEMEKTAQEHRDFRAKTYEISTKNYEGEHYRRKEMEYIAKHTILKSADPDKELWFMCGDFNCVSPKDNFKYRWGDASLSFLTQRYIETDLPMYYDIVAEHYPGIFCKSTMGGSRIDFVYVTKPMLKASTNVATGTDWYTKQSVFEPYPHFKLPSDHIPVMVDFNLNKLK